MTEATPFAIEKPPVKGETCGNLDSRNVVIYSHGFGVQRGGRGMATDLAERLNDKLIVLFDYSDLDDEGNATVSALDNQARMLTAVIDHVRTTYSPDDISVVSHSQGCIALAIACPDGLKRAVIVSPPMKSPTSEEMNRHFGNRDGTRIVERGLSTIRRSDGKITYVPAGFWRAAAELDLHQLYSNLARQTELFAVIARQDHVLPDQDYSSLKTDDNVHYVELDGDHDFNGTARENWVEEIARIIEDKN